MPVYAVIGSLLRVSASRAGDVKCWLGVTSGDLWLGLERDGGGLVEELMGMGK